MMRSVRVYLIALVGISVVLASGAFVLVARSANATYRVQSESQTLETAKNISRSVDLELQRAAGILTALRASEAAAKADWQALDRQARASLTTTDAWIIVQDRAGRQLVNTRLPADSALPQGAPPAEMWGELADGGLRACNLVSGFIEPVVTCIDMPVDGPDGSALAISMVFKPTAFRDIITREGATAGHIASLVDRKGTIIWRNRHPEQFVGKQASGSVLQAITQETPSALAETTSLEGAAMLTALDRSTLSGWTVVVGVPLAQLEAARNQTLRGTTLVTVAALALGCLFAAMLARKLNQAVRVLTDAVQSTDESGRVPTTGIMEFDQAARAIVAIGMARASSEHRQRILIGELNHRVKNTLAIVQSLAHQSFRQDRPAPESVRAFEGRLTALAGAHSLLTTQSWKSANMMELVRASLAPFCSRDRCHITGDDFALPPQSAVSFALALHELATNASKYGALSNDSGRITVQWSHHGEQLDLSWSEHGGPIVHAPLREGFGTKLIKRILAADLQARVHFTYASEGFHCSLSCRLPSKHDPIEVANDIHITSSLTR